MEKMNGNQKITKACVKWLKHWSLLLILLFFGLSANMNAQCTLVCNSPFPSSPLDAAVDQNCEAVITADMVLEDQSACPGPKTLEARTLSGFLIVSGPEPITIPGFYLGNVIGVTVIDDNTWNQCTGYLRLTDGLEPFFITCPNIEVSCAANTDPSVVGYPVVDDNCDSDLTITYTETQTNPDCSSPSPYISIITRTWIATDDFNNTETCTQTISLLKADIDDVDFPPNVSLSCEAPNTNPNATGWPAIDGTPIQPGNVCMFSASYTDVIVYSNPPATSTYTILRTWTVIDGCSSPNIVETHVQQISVADNAGPAISCLPVINVGTNSNTCTGTFILPAATVSDNCTPNGNITVSVVGTFGGSGLGPHYDIPAGTYTVTYTAVDQSGNVTNCQSTLVIADDDPPVAICDEFTVVSITSSGTAVVPAFNLDDGSYDNCGPITFKGSRNNGVTFTDNLTFTCADIGTPVNVILRVYSAINPSSFNDCQVVVNVLDKLPPVVICPNNQTIDCIETYPFDLSVFGMPVVGDNCGYDLVADTTINISNCGEGTILRSFTATDASDNTASCTQTLTVQNLTPFNGNQIQWPADYTVNDQCITADLLDPEDLPAAPVNYREPILPDVNCSLLATNYSDQIFFIAYPACYKIVRTWTVMDWCSYNPAYPNQGGIWYHTQVIKVNDNTPPSFVVLPPDEVYASVGANCQFGPVNLPTVTATDCSPSLSISNNSPYANSGGANASGMYPLGETIVKYSAKDGCGNTAIHTIKVIVEDNTFPGMVCEDLVTDLTLQQGGSISSTVQAVSFLEEYIDNCTSTPDLDVFIRVNSPQAPPAPPAETSITVTCADKEEPVLVDIWVVDEAGNANYCSVYLIVQDNFNICPPDQTFAVAGLIETEQGDEVENVDVNLSGSLLPPASGSPYIFHNQPAGNDYTVAPEKLDDPDNGVTTYDLVLISRHILGVQPLNSPYKIIAADANRSGNVSTVDMVSIRKIILGLDSAFPANTSWRFVDKDYHFPDPANPFSQVFPEVISINNLSSDQLYADFVAVKVGDVNGSAAPGQLTGEIEERNFAGLLELMLGETQIEKGQRYDIPVYARNFDDILGMQFTLNIDPAAVKWLGVTSCDLPGLSPGNFGEQGAADGQITFSWNAANGVSLTPEQCLFTIQLEAIQTCNLMTNTHVSSAPLRAEAYSGDATLRSVQFSAPQSQAEGRVLYQNRPNPFDHSTVIAFSFDQAAEGALVVYDLSGREVLRYDNTWEPGYYEVTIQRNQLPQSGMYYYKLETNAWTEVRKMIMVD
jgi:hypothetical protein